MDINKALNWYPINLGLSSEVVMRSLLERLYRVIANNVPGDVVEMGCHAGDTSVFFQRMLLENDLKRTLHLYDSFQGLPEKDAKDNPHWGEAGSVKTARQIVVDRFAKENLPQPSIHAGWFKDIADHEYPEQVAFAFFDGDFHSSIMDSFSRIWPRMSPGGVICVHDYGCDTWPGVTTACEEFLMDKPEKHASVCYLLGEVVKQ